MDIRDNISTVLTTFMLTPCILHFMFFSPEHILVLGGSTHPTNQFGLMNYRSAHTPLYHVRTLPLSSVASVPTPGVHQYSFPADQWTQLPSLAVPRTNHACSAYSGKVSSTEVTALLQMWGHWIHLDSVSAAGDRDGRSDNR